MLRHKLLLRWTLFVGLSVVGILGGDAVYSQSGGFDPNAYCSQQYCYTLLGVPDSPSPCITGAYCGSSNPTGFCFCLAPSTAGCNFGKLKYGSVQCAGTCVQQNPPNVPCTATFICCGPSCN